MQIGHLTLPSLCLPGTHDSLTYDLCDHPARGDTLPELMFSLPRPVTSFIMRELTVKLATCQKITIREQLDAGIRFIDFRVIWSPDRGMWVGVHGVETRDRAWSYLMQIRDWLEHHPTEIVVLWLSRHGNEKERGEEQYPHRSPEQKQGFFEQILEVFGGRRVVLICSDYVEFTGRSPFALDAADKLVNALPGGLDDPVLDALKYFSEFQPSSDKYHIASLANSADMGAAFKQ
ncbi:Plcxd1, partial [Symbiodinium sp. KB8]